MAGQKSKGVRFWALKIFIITLLISIGISVVTEVFLKNLGIFPAILVLLALIGLGVLFDIIGVAFSSCDQTPFISMSARKIKKANRALKLLKNADIVSNVCNDVVGDVCGIVSGAAGAAIVLKVVLDSNSTESMVVSIAISALISAMTVAGKALGKGFAMKNNVKIVETIGGILSFFERGSKKEKKDK